MRYELVSEFDGLFNYVVWFIFDKVDGRVVGNAYLNKYMAQTEVDRLNKLEEGV